MSWLKLKKRHVSLVISVLSLRVFIGSPLNSMNVDGDPNTTAPSAASAASDISGVVSIVNDPLSFGGSGTQIPGFQSGGSNSQLNSAFLAPVLLVQWPCWV